MFQREFCKGKEFMEGHLEKLRSEEVEVIRHWFKPNMRVLELGGGSGYQASVIASWGCRVFSVDLPNRPGLKKLYYPVLNYDGMNIPFSEAAFDILFSSNVLEHIGDLPWIFAEMHRVLKPDGLAVHILPSPVWRSWTSIGHYLFVLKYLFGMHENPCAASTASAKSTLHNKGLTHFIKRALVAGPHGEYPNALSEIYYFSKSRWTRVFNQNNFEVLEIGHNKLFYTGYGLFPGLSLQARQNIARFMGSACHIFIVRPKQL
jgi:SAM-dependent methyltransferase